VVEDNNTPSSKKTYVKICRSFNKGDLIGDGSCQAVFLNLIIEARRFPGKYAGRHCESGDVPLGISALELYTGLSKKVIWRCIDKLEKLEIISTRRSCQGTRITICNYLKYQACDEHDGNAMGTTEGDAKGDAKGVHYNKERTKERKKEIKKERKEGEEGSGERSSLALLTDAARRNTFSWIEYFKSVSLVKRDPDPEKWGKAMSDLKRRVTFQGEPLTDEKISEMIEFCKTDTFWKPNAASLPNVLKASKNGLLKAENILNAMQQKAPTETDYKAFFKTLKLKDIDEDGNEID
jgi:hypothetical protein